MEVSATAKFIRRSPRKVRLVLDTVRGKDVREALAILRFMPQGAANEIASVVASAAANAENNFQMAQDELYIKKIYANEGPTFKRFRARARGQGARILKRTSHITCVVEEREVF